MAVYTDLPVYEACYQLFLQFTLLSQKMQRDFRYSIGEEVRRALMKMITDIYKANYYNDLSQKLTHLMDAQERMVEVKLSMRMLNELRQLPDRHYAILIEGMTEVTRQLMSWSKSIDDKIKK